MLKATVCRYLFRLGISPRHKGFNYICDLLIGLMQTDDGIPCREAAARLLCDMFGDGRRSAERCMRYALQCAWDLGGRELYALFDKAPREAPGPAARLPAPCCPQLADFLFAAAWALTEANAAEEGRGGKAI